MGDFRCNAVVSYHSEQSHRQGLANRETCNLGPAESPGQAWCLYCCRVWRTRSKCCPTLLALSKALPPTLACKTLSTPNRQNPRRPNPATCPNCDAWPGLVVDPVTGTLQPFPAEVRSLLSNEGLRLCESSASTPIEVRMSCEPVATPFQTFLIVASGQRPLGPRDKLLLAGRDIIDPFNLLTIVGSSALAIASNADSVYGPGMPGFAKDMGVSFTQDLTGEFFGTFLIPSLAHQDPRFHRMPNASMQRRVAHAIYQVVWTQSDTGRPMFNYATVVGTFADDLVSDLYVPGRRHDASATTARVTTALASDPIDNFISEFLPDLARHVNIRVAFVQRIINRVALEEGQTRF